MRKELIERLRWHAKSMCNGDMYREAADMLEADGKAVPQEPVAFICHGHLYKWPSEDAFCGNPEDHIPLYAAPQPQPRLTDAEIKAIEHETDMKSSIGDWSNYFARAIEAKVRGEA